MKKLSRILTSIALAACATFAFAGNASAKLPADMEEFNARYAAEATTPEGVTKLWLEAAFLYQEPSTRLLGKEILMKIMKNLPKDFERSSIHATMVDRFKNNPEIQRSFCAGSSPENGYKADPNKCEITIERSKEGMQEDMWNLWLVSSGSDMSRQITLVKDGDHWLVWNAAGLFMSIKPAKKK